MWELDAQEEVGVFAKTSVFGSEEIKKALAAYLQEEIRDVLQSGEREELEKSWDTWRRHRECRPANRTKDTPWPGAANTVSPVTGSNTNGIYARVKNHIKRRKPLVHVRGRSVADQLKADALGRFLNMLLESPLYMDFERELNSILYETVSMGVQFVEIPWTTKRWSFKRTEETGEAVQVSTMVYDGPTVKCPKLEDVVTRVHWGNIQTSPWIAIRERMFRHEVEELAALGYFEGVEEILESTVEDVTEGERKEYERLGLRPNVKRNEEYEIYRVYVYWDSDGDKSQEDLIVWFHVDTGTILRAEYNEMGKRPLVRFPYLNMPGMSKPLYAIGVGWMSERTQEEIDSLRNMRINSAHIASVQMLFTKPGSGLGTRIRIAPALVQEVDNPKEDVLPVTFPDVTLSTIRAESIAKEELARFIGAGDAAMGMSDTIAKTRTTASGSMFLATRSDSILGSIVEDIENAIAEVGMYVVMQIVSNKDRAKLFLLPMLNQEDRVLVEEVLEMNVEDIPLRFHFEVKVTQEEQSEEAKRQSILALTQLYSLYFKEIMEMLPVLAQPGLPPQVSEFLMKFFVGRTELMRETLEMFGIGKTSSYIPYVKDVEFLLQMVDAMKEQQLGVLYDRQRANAGMAGGGPLGMVPQPGMGTPVPEGTEPGAEGGEMGGSAVPPGGGAPPGGAVSGLGF